MKINIGAILKGAWKNQDKIITGFKVAKKLFKSIFKKEKKDEGVKSGDFSGS